MQYAVYQYEDVGGEIHNYEVELPDGLTPKQLLILADAEIEEQLGLGEDMVINGPAFRCIDDVAVMDAKWNGTEVVLYLSPSGNKAAAFSLAEKERVERNGKKFAEDYSGPPPWDPDC